jgi:hypothetical protein
MPIDDATYRALRELTELAAKEEDPETLRQLVLGINILLDVIEERLAKLEGPSGPVSN